MKWVPLYMTGMIETYYCPRLRDGIYRRTLFVAEGEAALVSHTVGDTEKPMLNMFIREHAAVQALAGEFFAFLALCRPLIEFDEEDLQDDAPAGQ